MNHRRSVLRRTVGAVAALSVLCVLAAQATAGTSALQAPRAAAAATPLQIYGAWHCGSDFCTWATTRNTAPGGEFDVANHWLVDRGNGQPSVNLVVLAFVDPLKLLNGTNDSGTVNGVPRGMNAGVVQYFTSRNIRVMLSIGGITYTDAWNTALASDPVRLADNAVAAAKALGVGIEIDYENSSSPNLTGLQSFVTEYRRLLPYDASGANAAARLTIDVAAGDRWLIALDRYATQNWLTTGNPVLDYANAMVPSRQPSTSGATSNWQEHIDGKPQFSPPIPPLAPAKFTGSLYVTDSGRPIPECTTFASSLQKSTGSWLQSAAPNGAGTTPGLLGYMFWAAERPSTRNVSTTPPNTCEGGVGVGATTYAIPLPMPALRQS
jgi:hypothetical protein